MSKADISIVIIIALISAWFGNQLKGSNTTVGGELHAFTQPILIYSGKISGQTVMIDYAKFIDPQATRVQFMIHFLVGQGGTLKANVECFTKVYNTLDSHLNIVVLMAVASPYGGNWAQFSQSFILPTDGTNKVTFEVEKAFSGSQHNVKIYVNSYYK